MGWVGGWVWVDGFSMSTKCTREIGPVRVCAPMTQVRTRPCVREEREIVKVCVSIMSLLCVWFSFFLEDTRNEDVWYLLAVSHPIIAILHRASLHIARDTVNEYAAEEEWIEVWNRR